MILTLYLHINWLSRHSCNSPTNHLPILLSVVIRQTTTLQVNPTHSPPPICLDVFAKPNFVCLCLSPPIYLSRVIRSNLSTVIYNSLGTPVHLMQWGDDTDWLTDWVNNINNYKVDEHQGSGLRLPVVAGWWCWCPVMYQGANRPISPTPLRSLLRKD